MASTILDAEVKETREELPLERLQHFTWAWFTSTMSTGGIALVLSVTPHRFRGLETIGTVVFIFNLVLFTFLCSAITTRFVKYKGTLVQSLTHSSESLYFATFWLSIATIIMGIQRYGVPKTGEWLVTTIRVLFWIYVACAILNAIFQYHFLFTGKPLTIQSMTPGWLLPVFPTMLAGTVASNIASTQPAHFAKAIIVGGLACQGLGMLVAIFIYGNYTGRLFVHGLPAPSLRPGMFIAVGPPAFTALALIGLGNDALIAFPEHYIVGTSSVPTAEIFLIVAVFFGIFLWLLAFWWFAMALVGVLYRANEMSFHLSCYSFVFPNTGFIIATINIGKALGSDAILWLTSVLTILLVITYLGVAFCHIRALWRRKILWPGLDEDRFD
ncbi:MAG: hypothetical protein M1819_004568 [Sarea resinae]|nr:MAG: hypothetical protein M1819_004568 [Sarea resinae]